MKSIFLLLFLDITRRSPPERASPVEGNCHGLKRGREKDLELRPGNGL